eukprot:gene4709-3401_t
MVDNNLPMFTGTEINRRRVGFLRDWKKVSTTCLRPFRLLAKRPQGNLGEIYNSLLSNLCEGHEKVYELTTSEFSDSPTLERGKDGFVIGEDQLATQVLVILYLVRDVINGQAKSCKELVDEGNVSGYVNAFERFTCGVNCLKCCFTYHHWVWLKWGIPPPHSIPPTELMALVIWTESVVHKINHEKLKKSIKNIVNAARCRDGANIEDMESVKRLSLNLYLLLPDAKYYTTVVEDTYIGQMMDYFSLFSYQSLGRSGINSPEKYIRWCDFQFKREMGLACCFLHRSSYNTLRHRLIDALLLKEKGNLSDPTCTWLKRGDKGILQILAKWVPRGSEKLKGWFKDMVRQSTSEEMEREGRKTKKKGLQEGPNSLEVTIRAARSVLNYFQKILKEIFAGDENLMGTMRDEVFQKIEEEVNVEDEATKKSYYAALRDLLVKYSVEEIEVNYSKNIDKEDGSERSPESLWIGMIYKKLHPDEKQSFCAAYTRALRYRLIKKVSMGGNAFTIPLRREKTMLQALFSYDASFDFVYRCNRMIDDAYRFSVKLWGQNSNIRPIILKGFTWELSDDRNTTTIHQLYEYVRNFLFSYGTRFPGLKVSFSHSQHSVLQQFNQQRKWSVSAMASSNRRNELMEILHTLAKHQVVQFNGSKTEVEVHPSLELLETGTILLASLEQDIVPTKKGIFHSNEGETEESSKKLLSIAIEGQVVRILKSTGPLAITDVQDRVMHRLDKFMVSRKDVKDAVEKLIEKSHIQRDIATKLLSFVP